MIRRSWRYVLAFVVLLALVLGGGFWFWNRPAPQPTLEQLPQADGSVMTRVTPAGTPKARVAVAVMADARDLQKSVGNGDGSWFAIADQSGRGQLRGSEGDPGGVELLQEFVPTVYLYDNFPGGVGLSEPLWQRQAELVQRARELVQRCDCRAGCPACVGPVLAAQEDDETSPRALALRVLDLFDADACQHVPDVVVTTRDPMELLAP